MKKIKINQNIFLFYVCMSLFELFRSSFYGIGALFMVKTLYLSYYMISVIKLFNPLTIILAEIPSGIIADKYGRKMTFIISLFFSAIGFLIYAVSHNVFHAILAEIFYSLGLAFQTGSLDALIISQLKSENRGNEVQKIISFKYALRSLGVLIGGSIGIFLARHNMRFPWIFGAVGLILTSIVAMLVDGTSSHQIVQHTNIFKGLKKLFHDVNLKYILVIGLGIALVDVPFFNYWQIFMDEHLGLRRDGTLFLLIYIIYNLLMSLGGALTDYIAKHVGQRKTFFLSAIIVCLSSIYLGFSYSLTIGISTFLLSEFARGVFLPSQEVIFNKYISDNHRSLYLSKKSLFLRLSMMLGYFITAYVASFSNLRMNLIISPGIGLALVIYATFKMSRKPRT